MATVLREPLTLPCGVTLPNRVFKAAMAEGLATTSGDPSPELMRLYRGWAAGGPGALITGNIGVCPGAGDAATVIVSGDSDAEALARWAAGVHEDGVPLFGQLFHAGRQAMRYFAWRPVGPSTAPPVLGLPLFGSARELAQEEITALVTDFGAAAALLERAGFDGVEVHAAHGYLIGQFLSPLTNQRTDQWGGPVQQRARFLLEVIRAIRARTSPQFAVLVKINSSDFRPGGFDIDDSARVVGMLDGEGVDLVEVSGGTFESTSSALQVRPEDAGTSKDAYFAALAPRLRQMTGVPLALTGGLRSRRVIEALISDGTVDAIGMARPFVEFPDAAQLVLEGRSDPIVLTPPSSTYGIHPITWYQAQLRRQARGEGFDPRMTNTGLARQYLRILGHQAHATLRRTLRSASR
jgi:2,4-dienoyl-CoA reductase-like NADH-dependent reductase (Old Yellow Enzyme family)